MEFGRGRKRGRPEAALNGNGGFKRSKPGWVLDFSLSNVNSLRILNEIDSCIFYAVMLGLYASLCGLDLE